jgi:predicted kinase
MPIPAPAILADMPHRSGVIDKDGWPEHVIEMAAPLPSPRLRPAMVMLSGVVGTGKSTFARELHGRTGIAVIESDAVRRAMFDRPTHARNESTAVFDAVHAALDALLARGVSTLVDATNLVEAERARMYRIAERHGARTIIVQVTAAAATVRARLRARRDAAGPAEAGTPVFERMQRTRQPLERPHYVVDTTGDVACAAEAVAREIAAK